MAAGDQVVRVMASACPATIPVMPGCAQLPMVFRCCCPAMHPTYKRHCNAGLSISAQVPWSSYPDTPAATSKHSRNSTTPPAPNCRTQYRRHSPPYPEGLKLGTSAVAAPEGPVPSAA